MGEWQYARYVGATLAITVALALSACSAATAPEDPAASETPVSAESPAAADPDGDGTQNTATERNEVVPVPDGGTTDDVIEEEPEPDTAEVGLADTAEVGGDVTARIDSVRDITVKAQTPGEIAGPAVAVEISITNGGEEPIELSTAMVSLTGDDDVLGQPTTSDPYAPFSGDLAAGKSASATYVFLLPEDARSGISVSVQYVAGATIALFADEH